jgi:hypothetical protein
MRAFIRLADDLTVDSFPVSRALRYAFFSDCLRSNNYLRSSRNELRYWLTPTACQYEADSVAVLFAQEGCSQREREHIEPVGHWLQEHGLTAGVIRAQPRTRAHRLTTSLATALKWHSLFPGVKGNIAAIDETAHSLMREFDLSVTFLRWFRFHVAAAVAGHRKVHRLLERMAPRPKAIVFSTEYQPASRAVLSAAGVLGIPTVLVQHGFLGQAWLHWPIAAKKVCVWGEVDRHWYLERGHPASGLAVTGSYRAFAINRTERAAARQGMGLSSTERAVVFFAPNLGLSYHRRAAGFLREARAKLGDSCRWFVRLHPSEGDASLAQEYDGVAHISSADPLRQVYALADLVLHDHSTMAFAEYAGIHTATLALDPPYPSYYRELLGDQEEIGSVEALCHRILATEPGYDCEAAPTRSMATGGLDALNRVGGAILDLASGRGHEFP